MLRNIRALVSIVDYSNKNLIIDYYKERKIAYGVVSHGYGTAPSEILEYIGLAEVKKSVAITILEKNNANFVLNEIGKIMNMQKEGKGIAFTIPVSSMNQYFLNMLDEYNDIEITEEEKIKKKLNLMDNVTNKEKRFKMKNDYPYELIFTIVDRDHLDEAKDAAKSAGATGGTSIHALGIASNEELNFLGITISPEKSIMLNVVKKEDKNKIMSEIVEKVGIATEGKGICFSVPVDNALGLTSNLNIKNKKEKIKFKFNEK